ncbi:MAG: type II toxin-antitoxin system HicB family antitoxin [SAR324 cluster bacterium]|nr:type II toxin-antitoxin system HicB family antitoxin [SAR324 cluster bacterium]
MLKYKGYSGVVEYDSDENVLYGKVINANAVITFVGRSTDEIKTAFEESIDCYLETCERKGIEPKKPFSGNIRLRIEPQLHQKATVMAASSGKSLNGFISEAIEHAIEA